MKKCNKVILPISIISFSFTLISLNHALATYLNSSNAKDIGIGISGVITKLGDADYYLFWNNGEPVALTSDDTNYSYTQNVTNTGDYSYKITDAYSKTIYESDSFNLGLTGDFSLSFDSTNKTSSLTYSFSIQDDGKAFGEGMYCYPTSSYYSNSPVDYWLAGTFSNWSKDASAQMVTNSSSSSDKGMARHVYLEKDAEFKITNFTDYYGYNCLAESCNSLFSGMGDSNIKVVTTGYYDFYLTETYQIYASFSDTACFFEGEIDETKTITTFNVDATKYASSTTYLEFINSSSTKSTEAVLATSLLSSKTKSTCALNKNIYLNPNTSYWNQANAWFLAELEGNTKRYEFSSYDSTFYKISIPTSSEKISTIYCMANGASHETYKDSSVTIPNNDTGYWNKVTSVDIKSNFAYEITGWNETSYETTSIPTNAPLYTAIAN